MLFWTIVGVVAGCVQLLARVVVVLLLRLFSDSCIQCQGYHSFWLEQFSALRALFNRNQSSLPPLSLKRSVPCFYVRAVLFDSSSITHTRTETTTRSWTLRFSYNFACTTLILSVIVFVVIHLLRNNSHDRYDSFDIFFARTDHALWPCYRLFRGHQQWINTTKQ